jgi:hypothetical protein
LHCKNRYKSKRDDLIAEINYAILYLAKAFYETGDGDSIAGLYAWTRNTFAQYHILEFTLKALLGIYYRFLNKFELSLLLHQENRTNILQTVEQQSLVTDYDLQVIGKPVLQFTKEEMLFLTFQCPPQPPREALTKEFSDPVDILGAALDNFDREKISQSLNLWSTYQSCQALEDVTPFRFPSDSVKLKIFNILAEKMISKQTRFNSMVTYPMCLYYGQNLLTSNPS